MPRRSESIRPAGPTTPVPVKATESGLLEASLGIFRFALLKVVAESGLKATWRIQLPFGAIAWFEQVSVKGA